MVDKLTVGDRKNIDILSAIYDLWFVGSRRNYADKINYYRDQDSLSNYGFEYGALGGSMFGVDRSGTTWQVTGVPVDKKRSATTKGLMHMTTWYKIDERGLRHKHTPSLSWTEFHKLFGDK